MAIEDVIAMLDSVDQLLTDQNINEVQRRIRHAKAHLTELAAKRFDVRVDKMVESHRETWWVVIDHPDRPKTAMPWDDGRITPYMSEDKDKAECEADGWKAFFACTKDMNRFDRFLK